MASKPSLPTTNPQSAARTGLKATKLNPSARLSSRLDRLSYILTGSWALLAAIATVTNGSLVQTIEYKTQSLFFELRGPITPPNDIAILAMDDESLMQGREIYATDPQKYAYMEPIKQFPWKRAAYAKAIERLMAAGARSVAIDIVLDTPSRYGAADDQQLRQVLQRYPGRVTLAALYENINTQQGSGTKLSVPAPIFQTEPMSIGSINYPMEVDGNIRRFSSEYTKLLDKEYQDLTKTFDPLQLKAASFDFDQATLQAAKVNYPQPKGNYIYFYGPHGTFNHIPFWYVLDPVNWNSFQAQFKNKIVLIGPTATELNDFHKVPFGESWLYPQPMTGVEIHANAIATLLGGKAIAPAIPNAILRGLVVLIGILATGFFVSKRNHALSQFGCSTALFLAWGTISYITFVYGQLILPTAVPMSTIAAAGLSYLATGAASGQFNKGQLRLILQRYATYPIVRQIISQHDDLQDLLPKDAEETNKIIGGRYQIVQTLGAGGFGETYIAQDSMRPGNPKCVVKQLKPASSDPKHLDLARRLFPREAEALEKLGQHNQIPQLLAYFEEGEEFYLVQEFIAGHALEKELIPGKQLPERDVINMVMELIEILEFVHNQGVIHRDIKPNNIIRRDSDQKLVLIDFGAVKEITTQVLDSESQSRYTVGIGTQGYAPPEQCAGRPRPNSDIYALGIMAIKALTGVSPNQLQHDFKTGEILRTHKAQVSPELAAIISKMVCYDFYQRSQSASEVKEALLEFIQSASQPLSLSNAYSEITSSEELDAPTKTWVEQPQTLYPLEETKETM